MERLSYEEFLSNEIEFDGVIRNIEIIGEAVRNLPEEILMKYEQIPWGSIVAMRNKVSHEYFGITPPIIWATIKNDFPPLKAVIEDALDNLKE